MPDSNGQFILAAVALGILGALAVALVFRTVPQANHDYLVFILGTVAGAVSTSAGMKLGASASRSKAPPSGEGSAP
jgi:hypothetical protein